MSSPYNAQLLTRIVSAYQAAHGDAPASRDEMASWAIQNRLWDPPLKTKMQLLSDELSNAMGASRRNVRGRKVRQYHCIQRELEDGKKQTLWSHIDVATPEFLEQSISRRRRSLKNQNIQLHNDVVHINEIKGLQLELLLDYTDDVADYEHALAQGEDTYEHDILEKEF